MGMFNYAKKMGAPAVAKPLEQQLYIGKQTAATLEAKNLTTKSEPEVVQLEERRHTMAALREDAPFAAEDVYDGIEL